MNCKITAIDVSALRARLQLNLAALARNNVTPEGSPDPMTEMLWEAIKRIPTDQLESFTQACEPMATKHFLNRRSTKHLLSDLAALKASVGKLTNAQEV